MAELRISSRCVNDLTNQCANLFSQLSTEIQQELGNNWSLSPTNIPIKKILNNHSEPIISSKVFTKAVNTVHIDTPSVLSNLPVTPTRTPLTPVKVNSPSMLPPLYFKSSPPSPLISRKQKIISANQENTCSGDLPTLQGSPIQRSPRSVNSENNKGSKTSSPQKCSTDNFLQSLSRSSPRLVNSQQNKGSKTPSPLKSKSRKAVLESSCSRRSVENPLPARKKQEDSDYKTKLHNTDSETELHAEDILQPTPPPPWIKTLTPKGNRSGRSRNQDSKRMKQQTLTSMSKHFHKPTVDISTLKEFRGGARSTIAVKDNLYPAKRKSDEMIDESSSSSSRLILHQVFFNFHHLSTVQ